MRRFVKSRVIESMVVGVLAYWPVYYAVPADLLWTIMNGILMALWVGIMVTYWHGTWIAVRDSTNPLGGKIAISSIALLAVAITGIFAWGWAYQYWGQPFWMRGHPIRGWITWGFLVATVGLVFAGTVSDREFLPAGSWKRVGTFAAMAVVLTLAVVYTIGGFEP